MTTAQDRAIDATLNAVDYLINVALIDLDFCPFCDADLGSPVEEGEAHADDCAIGRLIDAYGNVR